MARLAINLDVDDLALRQRVLEWQNQVARATGPAVQAAAISLLQEVIVTNPVDTGRSRSAWVAALNDLGGTAPGGWQGPHPDASALSEGASLGGAELVSSTGSAEVTLTNAVDYIGLLEYGGGGRPPRHMVRQHLAGALQDLAQRLLRNTLPV